MAWLGLDWLGGRGETVKHLYISNESDKMTAVVRAVVQTGIGGDGSDKMTVTMTAQTWLVIRRRQQ